ncbi:MAG TPA: creatininase family protein [Roseiflexaceae bacterium]|nr:creatininase family protein [Roseiflexaceae bacterium]
MQGVRLSELTWEQAAEANQRYPVALLPIGAGTKEHGPHLPCGTDLMVVEELARRVVEIAPVLLLPALAYGFFPAFVDWPGSVSVRPEYFAGMVGDIVRSLARHGTKKFLLLDGGVSTHPPLRTLSYELYNELGVRVAITNILALGHEARRAVAEQESGGHADEIETSCMLAIRPELVHMERAVKEIDPAPPGASGDDSVRKFTLAGKMETPSGVNGDPTLATAAKGERVLAAMTQDIVTFLRDFAEMP